MELMISVGHSNEERGNGDSLVSIIVLSVSKARDNGVRSGGSECWVLGAELSDSPIPREKKKTQVGGEE